MIFELNFYGIDKSDTNLRGPITSLKILYEGMPKTSGCDQCAAINGDKNKDWCCHVLNPSMYYAEFLKVWEHVEKNWGKEKKTRLIMRAIKNYLRSDLNKGCIFYENGCSVHQHRPLACLSTDTIVLSSDGPKTIGEIRAGDFVLTHKGRYKKVLATLSKIHDGLFIRVKAKGDLGIVCTSDHLFFISEAKDKRPVLSSRLSWVKSINLLEKKCKQTGHYLSFPNIVFGQGMKEIRTSDFVKCIDSDTPGYVSPVHQYAPQEKNICLLPSSFEINDDFLWMIGLYLAEGCMGASGASFTLHSNEYETFGKRLENYFNRLGISCSSYIQKKENRLNIVINSSLFAKLIKQLCGRFSNQKRLHTIFFRLTNKQLYKIFLGWNDGDGNSHPSPDLKFRVTTISRNLLYQMYFILMGNDIYSFLHKEDRQSRENPSYHICVYKSGMELKGGQGTSYKCEENFNFRPVKKSEKIDYQDKCVFDLQVEEDESFVTSSGIVHNCRMYGTIPQESWASRWRILDERHKDEFDNRSRTQCTLVQSDRSVSLEEEDKWFRQTRKCEERIGVPENTIQLHDAPGGSYRSFHDHLLIELYDPIFLSNLTDVRMTKPSMEKIEEIISEIEKQLSEQNAK